MNFDWQIAVVFACVAWAMGVVSLRVYHLFRDQETSGCGSGGCHGCPSNSSKSSAGLVQLQMPDSESR